jgi:hypothetical protein
MHMDFTLAIVGAQLIDGVSQTPLPSTTVLIGTDGRIAAVGPSQAVALAQMVKRGVRVDHATIPRPFLIPDEGHREPSAEDRWWLNMLEVRWPFLHIMGSA